MAPEQFHGKAGLRQRRLLRRRDDVSDADRVAAIRHPTPADLARLSRGDLVTAPRLKNPKIPEGDQRHRPAGTGGGANGAVSNAPPT
jgi:hypothetical protein